MLRGRTEAIIRTPGLPNEESGQITSKGRVTRRGEERDATGSERSEGAPPRTPYTRFRIRAGRIPSWSRYLATVRRAILTPSDLSRFTIA